jgi:hypothetical protein
VADRLELFGAQLRDGLVQRIDIGAPTDAYTAEGIHIGSTEAEVRGAYGEHAFEGRASEYSAETELSGGLQHNAFLLKSKDGQRIILIETDGTKVVTIHVGVREDFYVVREDGGVKLEVETCTSILEGPPGGRESYP